MGGNHEILWMHVPGGTACNPQQGADSPRAEPAEQAGEIRAARDQLFHCLQGAGLPNPEAGELADAILADHAHELAEEIRGERDGMNIPGSPATPDVIDGMSYAASVIDSQRRDIDSQRRDGVRPGGESSM